MQRQFLKPKKTTNLFCIIGKPGTGKQAILDDIFSNARFVDKNRISRFVYGTTKESESIDYSELKCERYSLEEYRNLDPESIIESRSYDDIISGELYYHFTLEKHIMVGGNIVGIATIFQFEEINKWAHIKQMEDLSWEINIYPIYINSPLSDRIKHLLAKTKDDHGIYKVCARLLEERYEYRPVMENKVIDRSDPKVLYINNAGGVNQMSKIYKEVRLFIELHCKDV